MKQVLLKAQQAFVHALEGQIINLFLTQGGSHQHLQVEDKYDSCLPVKCVVRNAVFQEKFKEFKEYEYDTLVGDINYLNIQVEVLVMETNEIKYIKYITLLRVVNKQ